MNKIVFLLCTFFVTNSIAQLSPEPFAIQMEPIVITNSPGIHSYSWGITDDGKWVIVGGRIDGLHQRQPFAAFLEADNNKFVFVIDPNTEQVWNSSLSVLSAPIYEQLQSTNQEFYQRDSTLYVFGGYGYSATNGDHITHPYLTAIDINNLADAVINAAPISTFFRQIADNRFKVTGGQIGYMDSTFYLVGGQLFDGRYNPMGPNFGPGFTQEYTDEIRSFKLLDDGVNLTVTYYQVEHDSLNLHRRDYNLAKQIFPGGEIGFTLFSGVFDINDMPFLNSVDITSSGYVPNNNFSQYLSQYHSATIPIYDSTAQAMHTIFFGGMSQFYLDSTNTLVEDTNVPFVKTISKVTRLSDGSMNETSLNYLEMPALLGAGAEFIPIGDYLIHDELISINEIPNQKTLIGYIYGGIESLDQNIFFINDGSQSIASNTIFAVYINKSIVGIEEYVLNDAESYSDKIFPNPAKNKVTIDYMVSQLSTVKIEIYNAQGALVKQSILGDLSPGTYSSEIKISELERGPYLLRLFNGKYFINYKFVKK